MPNVQSSEQDCIYASLISLLGGPKVVRKPIATEEQAHDALKGGLPARAMIELAVRCAGISTIELLDVMGISARSFARRKAHPSALLSLTESSNVWRLAQLMAQATRVFGAHEVAERWFSQPALALNNRRPIDLLKTPPGTQLVKDLLTRMEYGVYS